MRPDLMWDWAGPVITGGRRWHIGLNDGYLALVSRRWPEAGNYSVSVTDGDGVVEFIHGLESLWEAQKEAEMIE